MRKTKVVTYSKCGGRKIEIKLENHPKSILEEDDVEDRSMKG